VEQFDVEQAARIAAEIGDFLAHEDDLHSLDPTRWLDDLGVDLAGIDSRLETGDEDALVADDLIGLAARAIQAAAACGPPEWGGDSTEQAQALAFSLAGTFLAEGETVRDWSGWVGAIWGAHEMAREQLAAFDEEELPDQARMELGRSLCLSYLLIAGGSIAAVLEVLPAGHPA